MQRYSARANNVGECNFENVVLAEFRESYSIRRCTLMLTVPLISSDGTGAFYALFCPHDETHDEIYFCAILVHHGDSVTRRFIRDNSSHRCRPH